MHFNDGSTYRNTIDDRDDIYILAVDSKDDEGINLAVLFINRKDISDTEPGELYIESVDFKDWVELDEEEAYV